MMELKGRHVAAWNKFWFERVPAESLGLVRMFFGLTLVMRLTGFTGVFRIDHLTMRFPKRDLFAISGMLDSWHMPYELLEWLPVPSAFVICRIEETLLLCAVMIAIGIFTRTVTVLTAVLFTYMFCLSQLHFFHHMYLFLLILWILALSPSGRCYSVDALLANPSKRAQLMTMYPLRFIQVTVCAVYFFTFIWKSNAGWLNGEIMQVFEETGGLKGPFSAWLVSWVPFQLFSVGTIAIEGLFPFLVWHPKTRPVALWAGVILHLMIDMMMNVNSYSYQMMVLYIAFIRPASEATVVLYDGRCALCQRGRRWANVLDWFRRLRWMDFRDTQVRRMVPQLTDDDLERETYVITANGKMKSGLAGWRQILIRLPLTFVLSFILYLPGVARLRPVLAFVRRIPQKRPPETAPDGRYVEVAWRRSLSRARQQMTDCPGR